MESHINSNFQRSQSKVWWSDYSDRPYYSDYYSINSEIITTTNNTTVPVNKSPDINSVNSWNNRQGSPSSHKSQDSGFSDSENSPILQQNISEEEEIEDKNKINLFPDHNLYNSESPDKLTPNKKCANHQINEHINQRSPSTSSEKETPPTVIRKNIRPQKDICISRRISFSAPSSPTSTTTPSILVNPKISTDILNKIDQLNYSTTSPLNSSQKIIKESPLSSCKCGRDKSIKRGRVILRSSKINRNLMDCLPKTTDTVDHQNDIYAISSHHSVDNSQSENESTISDNSINELNDSLNATTIQPKGILKSSKIYNNETIELVFNSNDDINNNNNNKNNLIIETITPPTSPNDKQKILPTYAELYPSSTSTPKMFQPNEFNSLPKKLIKQPRNWRPIKFEDNFENFIPNPNSYQGSELSKKNPQCVDNWLNELRNSYAHEVQSTLQTKSISVEAARNLKLTSATAAQLLRNIQTKVMILQNEFEKVEKLFNSDVVMDEMIPPLIQSLAGNLMDFIAKQQSRNIFYSETDTEFKKFEENIEIVLEMSNDLRIAVSSSDDYDIDMMREDIHILKRYVLITIRQIFEKLIKVIVTGIEDSSCDLILRSNLSTLSMISNIDYSGFASLTDAFLANETVRVLLIICIDSKQSSIRALALRSLATVCSSREAIRQLEQAGGIEILKDIMCDNEKLINRSEPELREAVSVLTQLTAPWHSDEHKVVGLKDCVESLVEAITQLTATTSCCQTLLLCAACLNNFSRIEPTSIYSLMSHETILKLKQAVLFRGPGTSIFLYEQITSMLLNMATNKKCHNHLGNKIIINFITTIFQTKFYEKYSFRAENDALKTTIKNILHIFSRLIHESIVLPDILEHDVLPILTKVESNISTDSVYSKDISFINKKLNESLSHKSKSFEQKIPQLELLLHNKNRHESYV